MMKSCLPRQLIVAVLRFQDARGEQRRGIRCDGTVAIGDGLRPWGFDHAEVPAGRRQELLGGGVGLRLNRQSCHAKLLPLLSILVRDERALCKVHRYIGDDIAEGVQNFAERHNIVEHGHVRVGAGGGVKTCVGGEGLDRQNVDLCT